ncbi:UDP-glycosyltransferase UGT5-like [Panulirus ornatus]|uniref:UDP-glycosyltransferase UGT5-like n=1 Tax=Panulirus ornatus TaxID=150431 RepID=UPI003A8AA2EB
MAYPFAQGVPLILVSTRGLDSRVSAVLGNVHHPAYVPNFLTDYPFPMSLLDRLRNLFYHLYIPWYWGTWSSVRNVQEEVSRHLPDIPPLLDIERNISLYLVNQNTVSGTGVPYLPSEVDVGGLHCVPGRPLPKTLDSWLKPAGASGVIYFSLGTVARGINMPTKHRDLMVKAFAALPQYRFIWKFESTLVGVSDNVLVDKYLPQQDILADSRVKLFITHRGCLSKQEAIYHATPLLVLPVFGDQPRNAMEVVKRGLGLSLRWDEVTVDLLVNSIQELINNPRYARNVRKALELARDQLQSPLERAVFWTEYVVRHGGAPQLKSPAAQLSWVEFLMLDVLAFALLLALILCLALRRSMRAAVAMLKRVEWKTKTD